MRACVRVGACMNACMHACVAADLPTLAGVHDVGFIVYVISQSDPSCRPLSFAPFVTGSFPFSLVRFGVHVPLCFAPDHMTLGKSNPNQVSPSETK